MKKVLIGVLALIMILGLVGCSSAPATEEPEPTNSHFSKGKYSDALENIYSIVKEKGEAHYNNDINNPIITDYDYEPSPYKFERIHVDVEDGTDNPEVCSYSYHGDTYHDESIYSSDIWYSTRFVLYTDGTTYYKIEYFRAGDNEKIFSANIDEIENEKYIDTSSDVEITGYSLDHVVMEAPEARKIILDGLYRDYTHLNTRLNELFNISLEDWGYMDFR